MKICLICESFYPLRHDATGKIAYNLAKAFVNKQCEESVISKHFGFKK